MTGRFGFFLNTKGTNDHEVSRELVDFLHYVERVDGEIAHCSGSERLQKIHNRVSRIKQSEVMGVKYMQRWEEKYYDREEGREEGRLSALLESVNSLMVIMGMTEDEAMDALRISDVTREVLRARLIDTASGR